MAKTPNRRKTGRRKTLSLAQRQARERQHLKRLLRSRNAMISTVGQLRRANDKYNFVMLQLAKDIVADHGGEVLIAPAVPLQDAPHVAPGS